MTLSELVQTILDAFGLLASDITALYKAIKDALLSAMQTAYARCADAIGVSDSAVAEDWTPTADDVAQADQLATLHAHQIAATYEDDLTTTAQTFLDAYQQANGTLDGAEVAVASMLTEWTSARSDWKSEQIATYECGVGADDGTSRFVEDLTSGNFIDTETGEVLNPDDYVVTVLPEESSKDECDDYAGKTFPLDEYDDLPDFPIHAGCPHYRTIIPSE